ASTGRFGEPPGAQAAPGGRQRVASVVERRRAVADELHQRRGALELSAFAELGLVEVALLETDRADEELPALLGELLMQALDRRLLVNADAVGVAAQAETPPLDGEPHDHVLALVEGGDGGEV